MSSYYSKEMLDETAREAREAITRVADWMARQTMSNMLHVDSQAAKPYGSEEALLAALRLNYERSFLRLNTMELSGFETPIPKASNGSR